MRKNIKVTAVDIEEIDDGFPRGSLTGFVEWLSFIAERIPHEFIDSAEIRIEGRMRHDQPLAHITVRYERPEKAGEELLRRSAEKLAQEAKHFRHNVIYEKLKIRVDNF